MYVLKRLEDTRPGAREGGQVRDANLFVSEGRPLRVRVVSGYQADVLIGLVLALIFAVAWKVHI